ncbi:putative guanine nucleotide-binding protein GI/GS/GO subunit gamma-7-like, partial [Triplophysa rosa]
YRMMQGFLSLNGFSEVGTPTSRGSLRGITKWMTLDSCNVACTLMRSMPASILSCSTNFLACAMLLVVD